MEDAHSLDFQKIAQQNASQKSSIILVVTRNGHLAEPFMEYAVSVADRLKCRLLVAFVNTLPYLFDGDQRSMMFAGAIKESISVFKHKAAARNVEIDYVQESGKIGRAINRLCHIAKRIEFVVIDKGIKLEEVVSRAPVPVFSVNYTDARRQILEVQRSKESAKPRNGTLIFSGIKSQHSRAVFVTILTVFLCLTVYVALIVF